MCYIKVKCQRMVGQCPACPIGRAVAGYDSNFPELNCYSACRHRNSQRPALVPPLTLHISWTGKLLRNIQDNLGTNQRYGCSIYESWWKETGRNFTRQNLANILKTVSLYFGIIPCEFKMSLYDFALTSTHLQYMLLYQKTCLAELIGLWPCCSHWWRNYTTDTSNLL